MYAFIYLLANLIAAGSNEVTLESRIFCWEYTKVGLSSQLGIIVMISYA